jgi:predicted nucleic acid-binding protein
MRSSFAPHPSDLAHAGPGWLLGRTPNRIDILLIAAQALALGCTVVTANEAEFERVPNLAIENWLALELATPGRHGPGAQLT